MRKDVAIELKNKALDIAKRYSNKDRMNNYNGETFIIDEIIPLSAQGAMVIFQKNTGKKAMAHFIHVDHPKNPFWQYYFLTSEHFINLDMFQKKYAEIEKHNFELNFVQQGESL
jgi:hypothetical protein